MTSGPLAAVFDQFDPAPVVPLSSARRSRPNPRAQQAAASYETPGIRQSSIRDAAALLMQEIEPVRYVIPDWMPEGLLLIAAAPKVGKSTLILQIAAAKAAGLSFWGSDVPIGKVLIIDLRPTSVDCGESLSRPA